MDKLLKWLIKSDFVRAKVLAQVRALVTAGGAYLVTAGYVDESIVQLSAGLAVALVGFWLGNEDVKQVDEKIKVALATPTPAEQAQAVLTTPTPQGLTEEQEREVTKLLNKLQAIRPKA